jgi:light-regulated signal transduction histidine kinase (bacteriophytochrome)
MNPNAAASATTVDLTNCDKEPIHIPGSVQPHGVLLVLIEPALIIQQVSANTAEHLGLAPTDLVGQRLSQLLAPADLAYLEQQLLSNALEGAPQYLPAMTVGRYERRFEGLVHRHQGLLLLELEASVTSVALSTLPMYAALKNALNELQGAPSVEAFCQRAAVAVRRFIGFDRVLIYKFLEDEAGRVIAEDKHPDIEGCISVLGKSVDGRP